MNMALTDAPHFRRAWMVAHGGLRRACATAAIVLAVLWPVAAADDTGGARPVAPPPAGLRSAALTLDFRDATLDTVLAYLSEQAGLIVMNGVELEKRVNVFSRQPLTIDEAVDLINAVLHKEGFTAIRQGRLLKVVDLDDAKLHGIPVRLGADPERIGMSDTVITQVVPVRHAEAKALAENLRPLVDSAYAELTANESSNALILTDREANVKRIVEIVRALDQSISQVTEVRVFALQYANAADTAPLIEAVFQAGPTEGERLGRAIQQRFQRFGRGRPRGGAAPEETPAVAPGREVSAAADERSNSVVVSAAPDLMTAIAAVVQELDADTTAKESVLIYHVRNMQASALAELFNDLFEDASTSTAPAARAGTRADRGADAGRRSAAAADGDQDTTDLVGQVRAVAQTDTNTLLVLTQQKHFERIGEILTSLDRMVPQVLIRVLVSEVTFGDDLDLGVQIEAINVGATDDTRVLTDFNLFESTLGLNFLLMDSDNFNLAIRALEASGKFDVLSRPYVLAGDNQEANITVGESVPFVTNSRETNEGQTVNTIEYRDVGIILTVTPQINDEGLVVLNLTQELSALTEDTIPISENLDAVVIKQRSVQSRIAVADGQTVVIGGLMEDVLQERISKVPLLGDIPLLGNLFKRTERRKVKTEMLVFLTPEVIESPADLLRATEWIREQETEALEEAVEPGLLQQHLERMGGSDGTVDPAPGAGE